MFVSAIETAARYTRALHTITRVWGSTTVMPGAATLFFVNADGWALTCKHVANQLAEADQTMARFAAFRAERAQLPGGTKARQLLRALVAKHGYSSGVLVEMHNTFVNCFEGPVQLEVRPHPTVDLALLKFTNFTKLWPTTFATFAGHGADLKQGMMLCRLGFPFPEFSNFEYEAAADHIRWTSAGRTQSPQFPIDGMVTRHIGVAGGVTGFELSTPGLRGQSGGPAFDSAGRVWGLQSATNHLDLDFDIDVEVLRQGHKRRIKDSAFLHVGHCVHVDVIKQFMRDHGVAFQEAG
jgi:hypothetical protein